MLGSRPAAAGITMSLLALSACTLAEAVDGRGASVELRSAGGSGCAPGSVAVEATPPGDTLTLRHGAFRTTGGDVYKNCLIIIDVTVPTGWTYAIERVDARSDTFLDAGATGELQLHSWFTGSPWTLTETDALSGPHDSVWETTATARTLRWAPCNESSNLNINETVRVDGPPSSVVAPRTSNVHLRWRRCQPSIDPRRAVQ